MGKTRVASMRKTEGQAPAAPARAGVAPPGRGNRATGRLLRQADDGRKKKACPACEGVVQREPQEGPVQRRCPGTLRQMASDPTGWKPYFGDSSFFHCGYTGFVEDRDPQPGAPMNECFYDEQGSLVTEDSAFGGCRGTPDEYDASQGVLDAIAHTVIDSGGIVRAGIPAAADSAKHKVAEWLAGLDCSIRQLYGAPC